MVFTPVGILLVDMLQNINSRHVAPLRQVKPPAWLKMVLGEDVILKEEYSCLQNVIKHGRWRENINKYFYCLDIDVIFVLHITKTIHLAAAFGACPSETSGCCVCTAL